MTSFEKQTTSVILRADIILFVLDARAPEETRNNRVERIIEDNGKKLIFVVNKSDMIDREERLKIGKKIKGSVFISSKNKRGIQLLWERIMIESARTGKEKTFVGVLGYPNVGKSTLINVLSNRNAAPAGNVAGTTKGVKLIKGRKNITLIDTPGVIPTKDLDEMKKAAIGSIDPSKVKDPENIYLDLIEKYPGVIEKHYGVEKNEDNEETLSKIALKKNIIRKGNIADTERMARIIIKEWQEGKIKY